MEDSDSSLPGTTDVFYGGKVLAKLEAGQCATLECARKRMKSNVIIKAGSGSGGNSSVVTDGTSILIMSATITREGDHTLNVT